MSLAAYRGSLAAQKLREAIDAAIQGLTDPARRAELQKLRGAGQPGDQDVQYGSIRVTAPGEETVVGLQEKFLYVLNVLQAADARPTSQAAEAVSGLQRALASLETRGPTPRQRSQFWRPSRPGIGRGRPGSGLLY